MIRETTAIPMDETYLFPEGLFHGEFEGSSSERSRKSNQPPAVKKVLANINSVSDMSLSLDGAPLGKGGYATVVRVKDENEVNGATPLAMRIFIEKDITSILLSYLGVEFQKNIHDASGDMNLVPQVFDQYIFREGKTFVSLTVMERRPMFTLTGAEMAADKDLMEAVVNRCVQFFSFIQSQYGTESYPIVITDRKIANTVGLLPDLKL